MYSSDTDPAYPLYDARWEHDACGIGFVAQISGVASHNVVSTALVALTHLTHRGAQDADAETGDGAGLLTQIPKTLFRDELLARNITVTELDDLAADPGGQEHRDRNEKSPKPGEYETDDPTHRSSRKRQAA